MKVCPVCQVSFAEGFVYCPQDAELLVRYDLRSRLRSEHECNFLLTPESLGQRLGRELRFAVAEFRCDPRGYLLELWRGEGSSQRRKQLLQSGVALAVIAYTFMITALLLVGLSHSTTAEQLVLRDKPLVETGEVRLILPTLPAAQSEFTRGRDGHLGGSLPQPQRAQGGGSGGNQQTQPANQGVAPRALLRDQLRLPDPAPLKIEHPSLIVVPTVVADPASVLYVKGQIGLAEAPPAPPSKGPGKGGGIGNQEGTGVGPHGKGAGAGPGNDFNTGTGKPRIGGDPTTGIGNRESLPRMANQRIRPTILYKEKAKYTEEARHERIQGTVVLLATFNANGQISDIRVIRGLPFGLTEEAIQSAKRIRFQPAYENGGPVTVRAHLEYNFALY